MDISCSSSARVVTQLIIKVSLFTSFQSRTISIDDTLTSSHDPTLRAMTPFGPPQVHCQPSHVRHTLSQTQMCSGSQQGRTQDKKDGFRDADSHLCLERAQPRDKPTPRRTRPLLPLHCRCRCDSSQRRLRLWHCCRCRCCGYCCRRRRRSRGCRRCLRLVVGLGIRCA